MVPSRDARTTPPWLRGPALALCLGLALLFGSAWYETLDDTPRTWIGRRPGLYWASNWSMFTNRNRKHRMLRASARYIEDGDWERVYLVQWFPARWESGLRFDRTSFTNSPSRMRTLAAALCGRMAAHPEHAAPHEVRFTLVTWRKTLGSRQQPRKRRVRRRKLLEWECGRTPPRPPSGRRR